MIQPTLLRELARVFEADARETIVPRIVDGRIMPPTSEEIWEHQRLSRIARDIRCHADAVTALRIIGVRP